jgi:hypothetical protein
MAANDSVLTFLRRNGVSTSAVLQRALDASQATLSRTLSGLGEQIIRIGGGRSTQYGARRELPQIGSSWPMFQVDKTGEPKLLGRLHALARDQYWFDAPLGEYPRLSDGLPFFLQDLIPQGFLGRTLPHRFPELDLPERITDWNDDHVLIYLCRRGDDCVGDLVLGDESLQRFLKQSRARPAHTDMTKREREYPLLAEAALSGAAPGSSAGGEHPKFTASLRHERALSHVLVKFSPSTNDRLAERWSDLLLSEHLATQVLQNAHLTPSTSEMVRAGGRTFLESERFDRHGTRGRSGLVSLAALSNQYLGVRDNWVTATARLAKMRLISHHDAETVRRLATFGRLIANTDMHFGNLSFHLSFDRKPSLAPVYDMLPMLYAPTAGDLVPAREFDPPLPTATNLDIWKEITTLAVEYWRRISSHRDVSSDFAAIASGNADRVATVAKLI